jgi:hypothetical protein
MDDTPTPATRALPPDMVDAVTAAAARDADAVGQFLRDMGLTGTPEQPLKLPARVLLHLAAALRMAAWETQGYTFHHDAGLPAADQAICDALNGFADASASPDPLCIAVLRLSVERFAWNGLRDWNADIALDDLRDDQALDVLAEFLWANRHVSTPMEDCQA